MDIGWSDTALERCLAATCFSRKLLILSALLLGLVLPSPAHAEYNNPSDYLAQLETKFFAHDYQKQDEETRIARLEQFVFGESKCGPADKRLLAIKQAVPTFTEIPDQAIHKFAQTSADETRVKRPVSGSALSAASPAQSSDYPSVTDLEKRLIGRTFAGDGIQSRLDRLEMKAFGKTTNTNDLAERVESLKVYTNTQSEWIDPSTTVQQLASSAQPMTAEGLLSHVEHLESRVFGRLYGREALAVRVRNLESYLSPGQPPPPQANISERIARLDDIFSRIAAGTPAAQAGPASADGADPTIAGRDPYGTVAYRPRSKHPFLHGLGKALTVAGQVAVSSLSTMAAGYAYIGPSTLSSGAFGFGSSLSAGPFLGGGCCGSVGGFGIPLGF